MRKFKIEANCIKDPDGKYTQRIIAMIEAAGAVVTSDHNDADAIVVLGGDGTLLKAAGDYLGCDKPLLGVNIGTLGYLTETDVNEFELTLERLMNDSFDVDERMMLYGKASNSEGEHEDHSLNDVIVSGCGPLSLVRYELFVNGELLNNYSADGLIISTPTGSTGYNMSAGGPIVEPRASLLVVTPICPHTLNTRSIVLSAEDEVLVRIDDNQREDVAVMFDGRTPILLNPGDTIRVRRSEQKTKIIKLHKESFLKTLHNKLK